MPVTAKKSSKKLLIIVAAVVVVLVGIVVAVLYANHTFQPVSQTPTKNNEVAKTPVSTPIENTTDVMTGGASSETSLTNTDDTSDAVDASSAAANVGDSVDEGSF